MPSFQDSWQAEIGRLVPDVAEIENLLIVAKKSTDLQTAQGFLTLAITNLTMVLERVTKIKEGRYEPAVDSKSIAVSSATRTKEPTVTTRSSDPVDRLRDIVKSIGGPRFNRRDQEEID